MKTRILSALIMLPLLTVVFFGGRFLVVACFLIGLLGVREYYKSFENGASLKPSHNIASIAILLLYFINLFFPNHLQLYMLWFVLVIFMSFLYLFNVEKRKLEDGFVTIIGIFYVVFFSFHVVLTDQLESPYSYLIWLIFISAFGTDIMAYFTGYFLGKHKLSPLISPKKTIEGAIGGELGSIIFCGVFGYFVIPDLLLHCFIIGFLGGIISQLGDLSASLVKRKLSIKDYGNLIPGHGGILDRFDSVLFTAPLVYYYSLILAWIIG